MAASYLLKIRHTFVLFIAMHPAPERVLFKNNNNTNSNGQPLLSTVPETVPCALCAFFHLILTTTI